MKRYFVMEGAVKGPKILLNSLPELGRDDDWLLGRKFTIDPPLPLEIDAVEDNDQGTLASLYSSPPIMSTKLYDALRGVGIDNLDVWDVVVRRADGSILCKDYKAFNLIGVVKAADAAKTRYADENPSRLLDASIESLTIQEGATHGLLMFRLAEYLGAVIVHAKVRAAVEASGIPNVKFTDPPSYLS